MLFIDSGILALFASPSALAFFGGILDFFGLLVLVVIGILVIVLVVGVILVLLPAAIVAIIVWFLTGSFLFAGIAFVIVAIISLVAI
jgi:hypothetical protein